MSTINIDVGAKAPTVPHDKFRKGHTYLNEDTGGLWMCVANYDSGCKYMVSLNTGVLRLISSLVDDYIEIDLTLTETR